MSDCDVHMESNKKRMNKIKPSQSLFLLYCSSLPFVIHNLHFSFLFQIPQPERCSVTTLDSRRYAVLVLSRKRRFKSLLDEERKRRGRGIRNEENIFHTMFTPFIIIYIRKASVVETSNNSLCISLEKHILWEKRDRQIIKKGNQFKESCLRKKRPLFTSRIRSALS